MSLGTPRRMKMPLIAAPPQSSSRDALQRAGSEVVCYLLPRACRRVGPGYPHQGSSTEHPGVSVAPGKKHGNDIVCDDTMLRLRMRGCLSPFLMAVQDMLDVFERN